MKYLFILFLFIQISLQSKQYDEVKEGGDRTVSNLDQLIKILCEKQVFDWDNKSLTTKDTQELKELEDLLGIMMSSRARQPGNVQRVFSPLHSIEGIVKKLHKQNVISQNLFDKFKWERLEM